MLLLIETSTEICSVCLEDNGNVLALEEFGEAYSHAEKLTVMIQGVLKTAAVTFKDLEAVSVSKGPGSYTGLRIGASVAKGLCYALEIPLIAISTLKSMANLVLRETQDINPAALLCPMIDARRMEVYCAVYDTMLNEKVPVEPLIISENSFKDLLLEHQLIFSGNGAEKCKPTFSENSNAIFSDLKTSSTGMITLAEEKFRKKDFADVSLFEPFYLKEVNIGKKVQA